MPEKPAVAPVPEAAPVVAPASEAPGETNSQYLEQLYWAKILHERLLTEMDLRRKDVSLMSDTELRSETEALLTDIVSSMADTIPDSQDLARLSKTVLDEAVGLGPLQHFLEDEAITEIMVNGHQEVFVERAGKLQKSGQAFSSDQAVLSVIERIITPLGRRVDESSPMVDARLKDGSRVNAIIPPLALKGPTLTIRKFASKRLECNDLVGFGALNAAMVDFLRVCVEQRKNIVVSGGTGSGKTTLLNVLSNFIPDHERIITVEDAAELRLHQPNLVSLEARPANVEGSGAVSIRDLVKNTLRMRPDRIVVGECRGGEALDMLQAMNTGHDGSLTTAHANSPRDALSRLEVMVLMAGMDLPVSAIREQISSAVNVIVQQTRFSCGARKITRITEVVGMESNTVQLQDIFVYQQHGRDGDGRVQGDFKATGFVPAFYEELSAIGVPVDLKIFRPTGEIE
jgi:pilus assembly protein CpaF